MLNFLESLLTVEEEIKGQCQEMKIFLSVYTIHSIPIVCALMVFNENLIDVTFYSVSETPDGKTQHNSPHCHWSIFYSVNLSLDAKLPRSTAHVVTCFYIFKGHRRLSVGFLG